MHGVVKASGVRRCVRRGCGAGLARDPSNSGHSLASVVTLGEARQDCFSQDNACWCRCGAGVH